MPNQPKHRQAKTILLKKVISEDEEYTLIANIPMMISKLDSGSRSVSKFHKREDISQRFINKNKKIIEFNINALKPIFLKYIRVSFEVDSTFIDIAVEGKHRLIIFPITFTFRKYSPITLINNVSLELLLPDSNYQEIIQDITKRMPDIGFRSPKPVLYANLDTKVYANITQTNMLLNYVTTLRLSFFPVREVNPRRLDLSTHTKRSSTTLAKEEVATGGTSESFEELQLPDIFEKLFGVSAKQVIVVDRPVVIFAEKPSDPKYNYIEFLKRVLRELYRVYQGGLPNPSTISTSFEEVKLKIKAGGHVYTLDLDRVLEQEREREHLKYLMDRLEELYSQGLGYLVLYGTRGTLEKLEKLGLAVTHLYLDKVKEEKFHSVQARKRKLWIIPRPVELRINEDKSVYCTVDLMWGRILNACSDADALVSSGVVLDYYATSREDEYYREIARIAYDPEINLIVEPSPRGEGELKRESVVHYALKALAVMHLKDNEDISESEIYTEYDMGDIVLDVYARHPKLGDLAIEIETLYDTALPLLKLRKTIESRLSKGLRTWIIIPSPQFFLFLPWIARFRKAYKKKYGDLIEFFTFDLEEKQILSFKKLIKKIKNW